MTCHDHDAATLRERNRKIASVQSLKGGFSGSSEVLPVTGAV